MNNSDSPRLSCCPPTGIFDFYIPGRSRERFVENTDGGSSWTLLPRSGVVQGITITASVASDSELDRLYAGFGIAEHAFIAKPEPTGSGLRFLIYLGRISSDSIRNVAAG